MPIRSNTVFAYWLILQMTRDEYADREASEETNISLLFDSEDELQQIETVEFNLEDPVGPQLFQEYVDSNVRHE